MVKAKTIHRQTVTLPAHTARRVRALAHAKHVSTSRLLAGLIEDGLDAEQGRRRQFLELARKFRATTDATEAERLGDQLGRMVFGG